MNSIWTARNATCALSVFLTVLWFGCDKDPGAEQSHAPKASHPQAVALGPESSPVPVDMSEGWCSGHGVPESVCTRCNSLLVSKFKEAGDWCGEHGLPESQCTLCNPEVEGRWAALDPANQQESSAPASDKGDGTQGSGQESLQGDWCAEHGVPESACTRCNPELILRFKEAGDWCGEHGLPDSQCIICNPRIREQMANMQPPSEGAPSPQGESGLRLERADRRLSGVNDALCPVESLRVRFLDATIARKAGIGTEPVQRRRLSAVIDVPAEIEFDATRVTRVTSRVAGILREIRASLGDIVEVGDELAVIDSPTLGEAKSRFIERRQDHLVAKADSERAHTIYNGVQRMLEACTLSASPEEVRQELEGIPVGDAKARLLRPHATLLFARADAARKAQLREKGISSEREYQAAQSDLASAEADFLANREEISFASERDKLTAERALRVAQAALEAAERQLRILGLTDEQVAAIGSEPDEVLSRYELCSPVSGRVVQRNVATGEAVSDTDVLFVVADTSVMWLLADVYERDLMQLREGMPVLFTVDGLPGASFEGRLSWIASQVNDQTRMIQVRAELPNEREMLRAKMFGRARLIVHDNSEVLSVPTEAVQTDGCCQLVFVRQDDTLFVPRKVVLGAAAGGFVEVLGGLMEGDQVATTGSFLMKTEILKSNIGAGCCEVDPGR